MKKAKAVLPMLVMIAVQVMSGMVAGYVTKFIIASNSPEVMESQTLYVAAYMETFQKLSVMALCVSHIILAVFMPIWFLKLCKKLAMPDITLRESLTKNNLLMALCFGLGIQFGMDAVLNSLYLIFPDALSAYNSSMQDMGMTGMTVFSFLTAGICAPIGEEMAYRGIAMKYLKNGGASFAVANVIQALLFALVHLNLVQGCYTFVMGLLFGYLAHKYNSVWVPVFVHMISNVSALIIGAINPDGSNPAFWFFCAIIGITAFIAGCLINKNNEVVSPVKDELINSAPQEDSEQA
ncbi:MAG: CPBP family intramembrane metalloprotease [Bacteroidaceae bacterium]|nr:CPBP family intramembrane metalloprotease [Bacteroidaceae bacterium]